MSVPEGFINSSPNDVCESILKMASRLDLFSNILGMIIIFGSNFLSIKSIFPSIFFQFFPLFIRYRNFW